MSADKKNRWADVAAIALLLLLLWKITRKKPTVIRKTCNKTSANPEFDQPCFNLNDYCQNVVYKPLSLTDLKTWPQQGDNWCTRGDRSIVDPELGYGDPYADQQAQEYIEKKNSEAINVINKKTILFRLINNTDQKITTQLLDTTQDVAPFNSTPSDPEILAADNITNSGFRAKWNSSLRAAGYYLDISTDSGFLSKVSGYDNKDVGDVTAYNVTGLSGGRTYYVRIKAYSGSSQSNYSGTGTVLTIPEAPESASGSSILYDRFTANWSASLGATGYYLDVATDIDFTTFVAGYQNRAVGNVITLTVLGLSAETNYYYRTRAYNATGTSGNSSEVLVTTVQETFVDADGNVYNVKVLNGKKWMLENLRVTKYADGTPIPNIIPSEFIGWYLPSKGELQLIRDELYANGLGSYPTDKDYWSSSCRYGGGGIFDNYAYSLPFAINLWQSTLKSSLVYVIPCRSFTSVSPSYSVRDVGPAGGFIIYKNGNDYIEAWNAGLSLEHAWSNVLDVLPGLSEAVGTGQANTDAIMAQVGHTDSAAKLCDDTSKGGWMNDTDGAYCWYNNDISNKAAYGAMYNWYAVNNAHGLAPEGWRIPTDAEYQDLIDSVGGFANAGNKLKEAGTEHWDEGNNGTNESGFTAVGSGERYKWIVGPDTFYFLYNKTTGFIWSSTDHEANGGELWLGATQNFASVENSSKAYGGAVRCVKDI